MDEPMVFRISGQRQKARLRSHQRRQPGKRHHGAAGSFIVNQQDYRVTIRQALADQLIQFSGQLAQQTTATRPSALRCWNRPLN